MLGQLPDPTVIVLGLHAAMCHVDISGENLTKDFSTATQILWLFVLLSSK